MQAAVKPTHSRTEKFGPVRLSYEDLLASIQRIRNLIEDANRPVQEGAQVGETLRLKDHVIELKLEENFTVRNLHGAPEVALDIWYSYTYSYTRRGAPISQVELRLGDFAREITVAGHSREQVDAVVGLVLADFRRQAVFLGGERRLALILVLVCVGVLLPLVPLVADADALPLPSPARPFFVISGPILALAAWVLPWKSWFPGTAVHAGNASWLVRKAPLVSLGGVLLTLLTFAVSIAVSIYLSSRQPAVKNESRPSEPSGEQQRRTGEEGGPAAGTAPPPATSAAEG